MEQRRGPGKPFHSAGGIRSGILPALLRDAQANFRTGAQASWQKKRLRAASSALVGPVRAALEADSEIVRRLAGRYAFDALQLGRALNDYYHHEQPPGAFADLQERIGRTARTLRRGVLNEHGLQGSEERGETFAKTCADQAVRGLRRRVLASLIMAMNRAESRAEKKSEHAGEAVEKTMQRAIDSAPRLAQDTGSRVLADATVDVAAEHDMLAVWRAATGECRFCRDMDGKPVDMGDGRGVHMLPPAHDGCTCTVELTAREKVYPDPKKPATIVPTSTNGGTGVKTIAKINKEIYGCISEELLTDEVIITDRQIEHSNLHNGAYDKYGDQIEGILLDPDYIFEDKMPNTGLVIGRLRKEDGKYLQIVLRVKVHTDPGEYKNSVISCWDISEQRLRTYRKNRKILYSRSDA